MTHQEAAEAFRKLADIVEANPKMELPYDGCGDSSILFMSHDKEAFAATVKAFGRGEKADGGDTLDFIPDFPIKIKVFGFKGSICESRKVTRIVEAQPEVTIPEHVVPASPAHEETVIEYACSPFLEASHA